MKPSAFEKWFKEQFGAVPLTPHRREIKYRSWRRQAELADIVEEELRRDEILKAKWDAALDAWQAKEALERGEWDGK